jgi:SAM domain (Sterile alpha motif)
MSAPAEDEIADWLKKLGMSEYAQRFAENRIDLSVLPDLTEVPSGMRLEFGGGISGNMRLSFQAARSIR